jgi:hypothetical protein
MPSDLPLLTTETSRAALSPGPQAIYLYGSVGKEDRAAIGEEWIAAQRTKGTVFVAVTAESREEITVGSPDDGEIDLSLFDQERLRAFLSSLGDGEIWLDITALAYGT